MQALSDTNRNGDERNGGVGLADYREPFEESGQDAKLSGIFFGGYPAVQIPCGSLQRVEALPVHDCAQRVR